MNEFTECDTCPNAGPGGRRGYWTNQYWIHLRCCSGKAVDKPSDPVIKVVDVDKCVDTEDKSVDKLSRAEYQREWVKRKREKKNASTD